MLHYSFSTILMTLLASGMILCFIAVIFLHKNIMVRAGYKLLLFCIGLILLRLMLPFEFSFTSNVLIPGLPAAILVFPRRPITFVFGMEVSLWTLFEAVWAAGIIFNAVRTINDHRHSMNYVLAHGSDKTEDPKYKTTLNQICMKYNKKNKFHVIETSNLNVPIILGFTTPYIALPKQLPLSSEQLYYVLCHEAMHYFHRDLHLKNVICILSIIYWWNPACILLKKQSNVLLEMRVDDKITQNDHDLTENYASCLLYLQKNAAQKSLELPSYLRRDALFFTYPQKKDTDMKKRFTMLFQSCALWRKICTGAILTVLSVGIFLASYLYILEPEYYPANLDEMGIIIVSPKNTYFIKIDDSGYEVYFNDIYTETVTSLRYYPKGIKIYNKEGVHIDET